MRFASPVTTAYGGGRRSNARGSTVEFYNFREYNQGDDFRRIDWNAYGRFEKFFIKLFLDERQLSVHLLTDISASMDFGAPTKLEAALKLCAAFAYMSVKSQDRVSVRTLSGGGSELVDSSVVSVPAFYRLLEHLETVKPEGETDLTASVKSCRDIRQGDGITVIFSDLMCDSGYKDAIDYLLYMHEQVVIVHILSPEEEDPALEGQLRLTDSESGSFCDLTAGSASLDYYKQALESFRSELRDYCMKRGVFLLQVRSDEDVAEVLLDRGLKAGIIQ